jgi:hypothetical protein
MSIFMFGYLFIDLNVIESSSLLDEYYIKLRHAFKKHTGCKLELIVDGHF